MAKSVKVSEVSVLCQNCTKMRDCLKDRLTALFMAHTTYCTRFDNKDKTPRLFPFLQPYEAEYKDAEYMYHNSKRYEKGKNAGSVGSHTSSSHQGHG